VEAPFYISFSGGRTSGYLLRRVLDAHGGKLPDGGHVLFANTGREHEATLAFVEEVGKRWCPVTWVEYEKEAPRFRIVTPQTAARAGEPFSQLLSRGKFLPNPVRRFCTQELKVVPMTRYMKSLGLSDFTTVIGLRADEPQRVSRLRADPDRDIAMPLADAGIERDHIIKWWEQNDFDLRLPGNDPAFGNCDLCFLKGMVRIERVIRAEPERAQWWIEQEERVEATFRKDRPTYSQLLTQITVQGLLFGGEIDDTTIPCDCTE
jgi:3'-phosphoadenosine 5'-phosphosulfate sulfotransferase (PAPS reductase)/FAD synthetase